LIKFPKVKSQLKNSFKHGIFTRAISTIFGFLSNLPAPNHFYNSGDLFDLLDCTGTEAQFYLLDNNRCLAASIYSDFEEGRGYIDSSSEVFVRTGIKR
jgi:hypothetical protein